MIYMNQSNVSTVIDQYQQSRGSRILVLTPDCRLECISKITALAYNVLESLGFSQFARFSGRTVIEHLSNYHTACKSSPLQTKITNCIQSLQPPAKASSLYPERPPRMYATVLGPAHQK